MSSARIEARAVKIFLGVIYRKICKCTPAHQVHPQAEQFMAFFAGRGRLGGLFSSIIPSLRATTEKRSSTFFDTPYRLSPRWSRDAMSKLYKRFDPKRNSERIKVDWQGERDVSVVVSGSAWDPTSHIYGVAQKDGTIFVRLNFIKYLLIFKITALLRFTK